MRYLPPTLPRTRTVFMLGLVSVLVLVLVLAVSAGAQDDEAERHGIFLETIDVNLVNVEVRVMRDGEPVTDLALEDFEILDDGEPIEATNFYRVEGGRRIQLGTSDSDGEAAVVEAGPTEPSTVVVLIDNAFLTPRTRRRVFLELREHLGELMSDGAQILLAVKDDEVRVEQRLTSRWAEVETALGRIEKEVGTAAGLEVRARQLLRSIEQGALPGEALNPGSLGADDVDVGEVDAVKYYQDIRALASQVAQNLRRSVRAMNGFLGSLAGLPGKKALIYACDELPLYPGEYLFDVWFSKYGEEYGFQVGASTARSAAEDFTTQAELRQLVAEANSNRVAFYPVGAGRSRGQRTLSAESAGKLSSPGFVTSTPESEGAGLTLLAVGTGGQVSVGSAHLDGLFTRLRQDLGHYYSLAYPAPHGGDGETHDVKVRVKRPGVQVSYLDSYVDKNADQQMGDRTLAALFHNLDENPLDVRILVGDAAKAKKGKHFRVPIEVRFPLAKLVMLPEEDHHRGSVTIFFVVRDAEGRLSSPTRVLVPIEIPNAGMLQALTQTANYQTELAMRPGEQTIAIGVRDDLSAESSTVNVDVEVGLETGQGGRG